MSFGSMFKTRIEGNNMFCDYYNPNNHTYCKRLRVMCPEHTKEPKLSNTEVCGFPLTKNIFTETEELCRVPKKKCIKHYCWEKLRRAIIDMERVKTCLKLDELVEQERQVRLAITSRAGVLGLMLHSTYDHEIASKLQKQHQQVDHQKYHQVEHPGIKTNPEATQYHTDHRYPSNELNLGHTDHRYPSKELNLGHTDHRYPSKEPNRGHTDHRYPSKEPNRGHTDHRYPSKEPNQSHTDHQYPSKEPNRDNQLHSDHHYFRQDTKNKFNLPKVNIAQKTGHKIQPGTAHAARSGPNAYHDHMYFSNQQHLYPTTDSRQLQDHLYFSNKKK